MNGTWNEPSLWLGHSTFGRIIDQSENSTHVKTIAPFPPKLRANRRVCYRSDLQVITVRGKHSEPHHNRRHHHHHRRRRWHNRDGGDHNLLVPLRRWTVRKCSTSLGSIWGLRPGGVLHILTHISQPNSTFTRGVKPSFPISLPSTDRRLNGDDDALLFCHQVRCFGFFFFAWEPE